MGPGFSPSIGTAASEQPDEESDTLTAAFDPYWRIVGIVNNHISRGRLIQAGESLRELSQWLSGNVDALSEVT